MTQAQSAQRDTEIMNAGVASTATLLEQRRHGPLYLIFSV
jgi:hypothetical protein